MELIIIYLIAVEVVIVSVVALSAIEKLTLSGIGKAIIRDGPELWEMLVGNDNEEAKSNRKTAKH